MWLLLAALLLPQTPQTADTSQAYLDAGARDLVAKARTHRGEVDAGIRSYETLVKERFTVGLKALRRDRLLIGQDEVARIHWQRDGATQVQVLGARRSMPMFVRGFQLPDDVRHAGSVVFEPTDDRLQLGSVDSSWARHPLGRGSEAYYRYQSGDTTTIRLPGAQTLRLLELRVLPRRDDPHLLRGSLWIDERTHGVVRGLFRLAADFDVERDADPDDAKDMKDVPGVLKPIRADLRYLTLEYSLVGMRWWMPRLFAVEGSVQIGSLANVPFHYERVYSEYSVQGDTVHTQLAAAPPDPRHRRPENCRQTEKGLSCDCRQSDCRIIEVKLPPDTLSLLSSDVLPPAPTGAYDDELITEAQMRDIAGRLGVLPTEPWRAAMPSLHWGLGRAGLARYNRVEGLSLGGRAESDFGPLAADATGRLGLAVAPADSPRALRLTPDLALGLSREGLHHALRASGYWRVAEMDPPTNGLGFGNSFNALFFGRDDGNYFRALGVDLARHAPTGTEEHVTWRLFLERQTPLALGTQLSLRRAFGSGPTFQENLRADTADEAGAELALRWYAGAGDARWGFTLAGDGAAGTYRYARPSASLQLGTPLPFGLVASAEAAAGTSFGTVPLQRSWFLGGPASLRGYGGAAMYGESFWRGRAELATSFPAARLALFGDAGWAGPRADFRTGRPLYSAGIGASFLDGYIRLDAARALRDPKGWRIDLYLDGLL